MNSPHRLLLDTDVLIEYLRGRVEAVEYLNSLNDELYISVITVAELYAGVREGTERAQLDAFILAFTTLPIDAEIALRGGLLRREYGRSHGTGLADALLAATSLVCKIPLVSFNRKHFPMLHDLLTPYYSPSDKES